MKYRIIQLLCAAIIIITACINHPKKVKTLAKYKARIYQTELDQFGYDIYKDSTLIIHQPIIPAISGNRGFATKNDAQKIAVMVISKLERGITPPAVTISEIDSLRIFR